MLEHTQNIGGGIYDAIKYDEGLYPQKAIFGISSLLLKSIPAIPKTESRGAHHVRLKTSTAMNPTISVPKIRYANRFIHLPNINRFMKHQTDSFMSQIGMKSVKFSAKTYFSLN